MVYTINMLKFEKPSKMNFHLNKVWKKKVCQSLICKIIKCIYIVIFDMECCQILPTIHHTMKFGGWLPIEYKVT